MNFKEEILLAMNDSATIQELKSLLICFKENGGKREDAHLILYELLQEAASERNDAALRELIDLTIGYSGNNQSIWN